MKYLDEYRDRSLVLKLAAEIKKISKRKVKIMEVCGGHTMAIHKFGIPSLLPPSIELLSGPGCPVCVTSRSYIDRAIAIAKQKDVIITTYGDLIRVPGSASTLDREKSSGADVRVVYSVLDALEIALLNPSRKVVFLAIGFETTTPSSAVALLEASRKEIRNFFLFSAHKIMPPAMAALIDDGIKIDGFIGPGHVSTITGSGMYDELANRYDLAVVISGFEPVDLMLSVLMLVKQIESGNKKVEIQYKRAVKPDGNKKAIGLVNEVFEPRDDWWRGLGVLRNSGLAIKDQFNQFNAEIQFEVKVDPPVEPKGCICGEVLKGKKTPDNCRLFRKVCTPENPVGACMVSNEGSCQAYYRYGKA